MALIPAGRHGKGLAKWAKDVQGLPYGFGRGLHLPSNCYALVTKNLTVGFTEPSTGITYSRAGNRSLTPQMLQDNIKELYQCAREYKDHIFIIPYRNDGKNLNGYTGQELWTIFTKGLDVPDNVLFHESFKTYLK